jgi:hypothetical protein
VRNRIPAVSVLVLAASLLTGCIAIKSVTSEQLDIVGKVQLTLTMCKTDNPTVDHPGCDLPANQQEGEGDMINQLLLAYRLPAGVGSPATVLGTTNEASAVTLPFHRSASYEAELTKFLAPGAGRRWVGYLSEPYVYDGGGASGDPARELAVVTGFDLPRAVDGGPFAGPLRVRPVVGGRVVTGDPMLFATRPVDCGDSPYGISTFPGGGTTACITSPVVGDIDNDYSLPTRDFGVVTGAATASPGQSVQLPFDVRAAGALPAGLTASITASSSLPGTTATPSQASVPLANGSSTRVTVPIAIPASAGPGTYNITVAAKLANGQTRTGTSKLTVRDRQKPVLSRLKLTPKAFRPGIRVPSIAATPGSRVSYSLSESAATRFVVERCAKRAGKTRRQRGRCVRFATTKKAVVRASSAGANSFRLTGFFGGKRLKAGPYRLAATPTDAGRNQGATVRARFTVRR